MHARGFIKDSWQPLLAQTKLQLLSKNEKKNRDSELVLFQVGAVKMCSLQRLALSILLLGASLQLSASWPNRLTRTTVCEELHVTHPGQNLVLQRGNVSLVLLKNGREVSCYEPEQEYEGMRVHSSIRERERKLACLFKS